MNMLVSLSLNLIEFSPLQITPTWLVTVILFFLIVGSYWAGHKLRLRTIARRQEHANISLATENGVLLGLLGLLLAFTFSMSNFRFDMRRELLVEEANNIGTAVLRADLYPDSTR